MKTKMNACRLLLGAMLVVALSSCERRPLYDEYGSNVIVDIDVDTADVVGGWMPEVMNVRFFTQSGAVASNSYLAAAGGPVNVDPDTYNVLAFNFDTEYTILRNEDSYSQCEAYTSETTRTVRSLYSSIRSAFAKARGEESGVDESLLVVYPPDHLFVADTVATVPVSAGSDDICRIHLHATSIIETYYLTIRFIQGMNYVSNARAFISGMGESKRLSDRQVTGSPAAIFTDMQAADFYTLTTTFNTFGRHPGETNKVYLVITTTDSSATVLTWEWDVTDQMDTGSHHILIEETIEIPPTDGGGGFNPDVDDWDNIITNIDM